ncbi:MBL fold metallo-hydrolase [Mycolicibacterium confluentis]|uniref:Uncharacterized protein n=1 Tax=Mycolicibacterium confluentis TaxID=28047 RepID=A0A7I7XWG3_9MYCO|nr:hypothetical protein [Mycolicibacterium confluentis]ORV32098.1 hypothetical protein AWB99_10585 [Mycolicibacterium confluentis]BBZ33655.1 hypothetical protein MCNF_22600 [Mycolicibacterium confluentis]
MAERTQLGAASLPTEEHQARLDASRILFSDSIIPVAEAGQIEPWSEDHRISDSLRLRPAPGHTRAVCQ